MSMFFTVLTSINIPLWFAFFDTEVLDGEGLGLWFHVQVRGSHGNPSCCLLSDESCHTMKSELLGRKKDLNSNRFIRWVKGREKCINSIGFLPLTKNIEISDWWSVQFYFFILGSYMAD
jgi:hypothetical protein